MYIKSGYMYKTVPFSRQYCFSCFHKVLVSIVTLDCIGIIRFIYCQMFIMQQLRSYCHFIMSSCSNSHPGHGTKFVTFPSSILLYEFYIKAGSMCFKICYCNHYLMWLVLLLLCGHKWDSSFYENSFCTINHDE